MTLIAAYDNVGIWGVGENEAQARAEAEGFIRDNLPASTHDDEIAKLRFAPMSDGLVDALDDWVENYDGVAISKSDLPFVLDVTTGELIYDPDAETDESDDDEGEAVPEGIDDIADGVQPSELPEPKPEE